MLFNHIRKQDFHVEAINVKEKKKVKEMVYVVSSFSVIIYQFTRRQSTICYFTINNSFDHIKYTLTKKENYRKLKFQTQNYRISQVPLQ